MKSKLVGYIKEVSFFEQYIFITTTDNRYYKFYFDLYRGIGISKKLVSSSLILKLIKENLESYQDINIILNSKNIPMLTIKEADRVKGIFNEVVLLVGTQLEEVNELDVLEELLKGLAF